MLATVLIFTGVMATVLQQERQVAYENEVRLQAQEIAEYMTNLNQLSSLRDNATMQYIVRRKIADIHDKYNADIWIVSYNSGLVQILDSSWNTSESLFSDSVMAQLALIQSGAGGAREGPLPRAGRADRDHRRALALHGRPGGGRRAAAHLHRPAAGAPDRPAAPDSARGAAVAGAGRAAERISWRAARFGPSAKSTAPCAISPRAI